jgi:hypothetical protein
MAVLTWVPTTLMPHVGHLWTGADATECQCRGTQGPTGLMTARCLTCIRTFGDDVASRFPDVKWLTRPTAPLRHGIWPAQLRREHAAPICRLVRLSVGRLYDDPKIVRCATCVETLRRQPHRLVSA